MAKGRNQNSSVEFTNTVPNKSAMQAILQKQDAVIDEIKAIKDAIEDAADLAALKVAIAALADLEKVELI